MEKLVITAAINGGGATLAENPNLPVTVEDTVREALACHQAGASIVHLHARDPETGGGVHDGRRMNKLMAEYMRRIRAESDMLVNLTTGGGRIERGGACAEDLEMLRERLSHKPDLVSLNMGSINAWAPSAKYDVFTNPDWFVEKLVDLTREYGVKAELAIYDTGMINACLDLIAKGKVKTPAHFAFVLGIKTGMQATVKNLVYLTELIPAGSTWHACGMGWRQFPIQTLATIMGGHLRVGFEDNIRMDRNTLAPSNADQVKRVVRIANELGREVAGVEETRRIYHLNE